MKTSIWAEVENTELPKIVGFDVQAIGGLLWIEDAFAGVLEVPECSVARTLILLRQLELRSDTGVQLRFEYGPAAGQIVCHLRREATADDFGLLGAGVVRAMGLIAQVVRVANVLPTRPVVVVCAAGEAWRLDDLSTISAGLVGSGRSAA